MDSFADIWDKAVDLIAEDLSSVALNTWIMCINPEFVTDDSAAVLTVQTGFQRDVISSRYMSLIRQSLCDALGFQVEVLLRTPDEPLPPRGKLIEETMINQPFDIEYTFENFIVGGSNKFAHAACLAVARTPATSYNPLFIYGGSGLGKTHLLYAIKNEVNLNYPDYKVVYIKGDDFTNELIESIRSSKAAEFRNKYRYADVFLVDDIQFIGGRESTQEEFFHTFNSLYEAKKQIVLTSDRPPKEIQTLEERLRTRFEWGLIADIAVPDFETRIAIITRKAESLSFELPREVTEFIAGKLKNNIRQLEGAVKKIRAYNLLKGEAISTASAAAAIKDILNENVPQSVTVAKIIHEVGLYYNVPAEDIRSKKRTYEISTARHVAMFMIRETTGMSLPQIGAEFSNRDHTTVLHGIRKVEAQIVSDPSFKNTVQDLINNIRNY